MFLTLLIGSLILLIVWDYFNKQRRNAVLKKSKITGRPAIPVLGNALEMRGLNSESMLWCLASVYKLINFLLSNRCLWRYTQ